MIVQNKSKINFGLNVPNELKLDAINGSKSLAEKMQVKNHIKVLSSAVGDDFSLSHRFGKADGSDVFEFEIRLSQKDNIMDVPLAWNRVGADEYVNYGIHGKTVSEELQNLTTRNSFMGISVEELQKLAKDLASGDLFPF